MPKSQPCKSGEEVAKASPVEASSAPPALLTATHAVDVISPERPQKELLVVAQKEEAVLQLKAPSENVSQETQVSQQSMRSDFY